ncbi:hypothetical protein ACLOJK_008957 [Asimina triloba]
MLLDCWIWEEMSPRWKMLGVGFDRVGFCPLLACRIMNEGGVVADCRSSLRCCSLPLLAVEEDDGAPAASCCSADRDGGFADLSRRMEGTMLDLSSTPAGSSSAPVFTVAGDGGGTRCRRYRAAVGWRRRRWVAVSPVLGSRPRCRHAGPLGSVVGGVTGGGFLTAARVVLVILIGTDRSPGLSPEKSTPTAMAASLEGDDGAPNLVLRRCTESSVTSVEVFSYFPSHMMLPESCVGPMHIALTIAAWMAGVGMEARGSLLLGFCCRILEALVGGEVQQRRQWQMGFLSGSWCLEVLPHPVERRAAMLMGSPDLMLAAKMKWFFHQQ